MYDSVPEACDATIKTVDASQPDPARTAEYEKWLKEYRQAYKALKPGFRRIADLLA
jgi:sugar (pentulose or hexulose) kinase